ncbi:MAG: hypothetical protein ACYC2O_11860, partial [Microthrixaceae bacterium]
ADGGVVFRAGDARKAGARSTVPDDATGLPAVGVYTYAATGEEVVKLGPLPAETRPFPETVTAVVVAPSDAPDCFDWTLNLFAEHVETTRWCDVGDQLRLDAHTKHQKIGVLSPTASMACDPNLLPSDGAAATSLSCRLELSGGPASIAATLDGPATAAATEDLTVGGETVRATPVTVQLNVTGDLSGAWTETTWWSEDHLPVRVERSLELAGLASFTEQSALELVSLEPQT